ncbi:hypothetical protein D3C86_1731110 [compost metagenome]
MKHLRLTRIEMIEHGDQSAGGDILPHGESGKTHQPDAGKRQTAKAFTIAHLHTSRRRDEDGLSVVPQWPPVD